jgi:hypothetical protein
MRRGTCPIELASCCPTKASEAVYNTDLSGYSLSCILACVDEQDADFKAALARRVQVYRERLARIDTRMAEWAAEREEIDARRVKSEALYESEFGEPVPELVEPEPVPDADRLFRQPVQAPAGPLTSLAWDEALARVLQGHPDGLHVRAVWDQLKEGGFRTDARDPVRSIVAIALRRPDVFVRTGPNTYGLVNEVVDAASDSRVLPEAGPQSLEVD